MELPRYMLEWQELILTCFSELYQTSFCLPEWGMEGVCVAGEVSAQLESNTEGKEQKAREMCQLL